MESAVVTQERKIKIAGGGEEGVRQYFLYNYGDS